MKVIRCFLFGHEWWQIGQDVEVRVWVCDHCGKVETIDYTTGEVDEGCHPHGH